MAVPRPRRVPNAATWDLRSSCSRGRCAKPSGRCFRVSCITWRAGGGAMNRSRDSKVTRTEKDDRNDVRNVRLRCRSPAGVELTKRRDGSKPGLVGEIRAHQELENTLGAFA